jgi:hypothetical protein
MKNNLTNIILTALDNNIIIININTATNSYKDIIIIMDMVIIMVMVMAMNMSMENNVIINMVGGSRWRVCVREVKKYGEVI